MKVTIAVFLESRSELPEVKAIEQDAYDSIADWIPTASIEILWLTPAGDQLKFDSQEAYQAAFDLLPA